MVANVVLAVASLLSLNPTPSNRVSGQQRRYNPALTSRASGLQPRGNAVLRDARRPEGKKPLIVVDTPQQTARLRAAAMNEFGLNINDYWTLRSGTIAEALPSTSQCKAEAIDRMRRKAAAQALERKRQHAESRLQAAVRERGGLGRRSGDTRTAGRRPSERSTVRAPGSNARAAAQLCVALAEARRLGVRTPHLLKQAEALQRLLEQAAADEHARREQRERQPQIAQSVTSGDAEAARREALVHRLAVYHWGGAGGGLRQDDDEVADPDADQPDRFDERFR